MEAAGARSAGPRRWHGRIALAASLVLVSAFGLAGDALGDNGFAITDLGTLGGDASEANAINATGQIVGWSTTAEGVTRAFLYTGGTMVDLGTLPGGRESQATGINDHGHVVGFAGINEFGPQFREVTQGFIWREGAMRSLGTLYCPCSYNERYGSSRAYAINAGGRAVGDSGTIRGESVRHAFIWQHGVITDIGGGPGGRAVSVAYGINATGHVAGTFDGRAALWQGEARRDLGGLSGHAASNARGINAAGVVVGDSGGPATPRAALWRDTGIMDLGTLPGDAASQANAINGAGHIVGWSRSVDGSASRAVLWRGGVMSDLNDLIPRGAGWMLARASAINDAGQIVGAGVRDGRARAFLLTPGPRVTRPAVSPARRSMSAAAGRRS